MVQSEFNDATRTLFLHKENKLSPLVQHSAILENIRWTQAAYAVLCQPHTRYAFRSNQSVNKHRIRICAVRLNKVIFFVFFAQKKCSRHFIIFGLNHWWQMDYSDDAFHTFLGFAVLITWQSLGQSQTSQLSKDERSFYGFGTTWG